MMIDATVAPKVEFVSPFGTTACNVNHINAGPQRRLAAGARYERTLEGVGSGPACGWDQQAYGAHGLMQNRSRSYAHGPFPRAARRWGPAGAPGRNTLAPARDRLPARRPGRR